MEGRREKENQDQVSGQKQPNSILENLEYQVSGPEQPNSILENLEYEVSGQEQLNSILESQVCNDQYHICHPWNTEFLAPGNHRPLNPNFQSPGLQNQATTQSHFLQSPGMQNHATTQSHFGMLNLATTQSFGTDPMNQRYYNICSTDSRGQNNSHDNVFQFQGQSNNVLGRLNQSTPSRDGFNYSVLSSPYKNNQEDSDTDEQIRRLQRLTIDHPDRVRQRASVYTRANTNSFPFIINEDHSANYLTNIANQQYGNIQNGAQNLAAATANISNFLRHETRLSDEFSLGYSSARLSSSTRNRSIRLDLGSQYNRGRSVTNGFHQVVNSSTVPSSSLYNNHNIDRARQRPTTVGELRGRLCLVAKDQHRSRFLQEKVDERNPQIIEMIFTEVKDEWYELMVHQFGNHLIQKLLGSLNQDQMTQFVIWIAGSEQRLFKLCEDVHGTRVMQQLMDLGETLTPEQTSILVSTLRNVAVKLSKSSNGYRVMLRFFQKFSNESTKDLVEQMAENCLSLAIDKNGCCVLPQCIIHAQEEQKGPLTADIVSNALVLAEHPFGNYVLQSVLGMKIPQVTADIVSQLAGNYFTLSQGICSSNVVEKCMKESGVEQCCDIINEIIHHPDVLHLMQHPYGNFVIQSAWKLSEGRPVLQQAIYHLVQTNSSSLQSHIYGRKVLKTVRGNRYR